MNSEGLKTLVGDQETDGAWLSLEDAAQRLGVTPYRVRTILRRTKTPVRGSQRDPFLREAVLPTLRCALLEEGPTDPDASAVAAAQDVDPDFDVNRLIVGDAMEVLRTMPSGIVQTAVTSPPFWGQRVYADERAVTWRDGTEVAFGREETPEAYAEHSADVLVELARVVADRGTIWWNIGDTYLTRTILHGSSMDRILHYGGKRSPWAETPDRRTSKGHSYLKDKDLTLVPFLVAKAAQRRGLWLRSVIVWSKQHPQPDGEDTRSDETRAHMPEPVLDRPVTGHEYILLFAKSASYDYFSEGLRGKVNGDGTPLNVRSVWTFKPATGPSAHGARFPDELPRRCIALSSRERDLVLDPFAGHATSLFVAAEMGRRYLGIEISPTYAAEAEARLAAASPAPHALPEVREDPGLSGAL